jgi:hypothetical protein
MLPSDKDHTGLAENRVYELALLSDSELRVHL